MNQPAGEPNELCAMRYFTPQLYLQLNCSDDEVVDQAMEGWEKALSAYRKHLKRIQRQLPPQLREFARTSFHDWNLVRIVRGEVASRADAGRLHIALKNGNELAVLWYSLCAKLHRIDSPQTWPFPTKKVDWLYDEIDVAKTSPRTFVHRILFSDGTTLLVPFSICGVLQLKSDRAMSHSELMKIA